MISSIRYTYVSKNKEQKTIHLISSLRTNVLRPDEQMFSANLQRHILMHHHNDKDCVAFPSWEIMYDRIHLLYARNHPFLCSNRLLTS